MISLKETIHVRTPTINDANDFGPASYKEFEEFLGIRDQRNIGELMSATQIAMEVHTSKYCLKSSLF